MTQNEIGLFHKEKILNILKMQKNLSRADLARILDLKKSSISLIIEKLIEQGFIREAKNEKEVIKNGRKPTPLEINPGKGYVVGIEVGFQGLFCILVDFQGNICAREKDCSAKKFRNGEDLANAIFKMFKNLAKRAGNILGVGIGISARVDVENGVILSSNLVGGENILLKKILEGKTGIPVFLDSNDNIGGFCEKHLGKGINSGNMVYIQRRGALGTAIFINGELYRGFKNYAGELTFYIEELQDRGHSKNAYGPSLHLRNYFLLELNGRPHPLITQKCGGNKELLTEDMIYEAAQEKDDFAFRIVKDYAEHYGILAAHIADFLSPDLIVFGGDFVEGGTFFIETAERAFRAKASKGISEDVKIAFSLFGNDEVALGATVFAFIQLYRTTNLLE